MGRIYCSLHVRTPCYSGPWPVEMNMMSHYGLPVMSDAALKGTPSTP